MTTLQKHQLLSHYELNPRCFLTVLTTSETCINSCRVVFLLLNMTIPLLSVESMIVTQYGVPISSW